MQESPNPFSSAYDNRRRVESTYSLVSYGFECTIGKERMRVEALKRLGGQLHEARGNLQSLRATKHSLPRRSIDVLIVDLDGLYGILQDNLNIDQIHRCTAFAQHQLSEFEHKVIWTADYDRNKSSVIALTDRATRSLGHDPILAYAVCVELSRLIWRDFRKANPTSNAVFREIRFAPHQKHACISILSYFSTILEQKLPHAECSVSIRQLRDRVVLTIEHPNGDSERVEKLLSEFTLVVARKVPIEHFLTDPFEAIALRQKLEIAELELRQSRDLLAHERRAFDSKISGIEAEVSFLRNHLELSLADERRVKEQLYDLFRSWSGTSPSGAYLEIIGRLVDAAFQQNQNLAVTELQNLKSEQPDIFERLSRYIAESATSGAIGNAFYDWLKILWPILPK